jgi:hypothetical protein
VKNQDIIDQAVHYLQTTQHDHEEGADCSLCQRTIQAQLQILQPAASELVCGFCENHVADMNALNLAKAIMGVQP